MYVTNNLSEILRKKFMSYRDLAMLSGVSKSAIEKIVRCEADPKQSTMMAIARALHMNVSDIFNLDWRKHYE